MKILTIFRAEIHQNTNFLLLKFDQNAILEPTKFDKFKIWPILKALKRQMDKNLHFDHLS